MCMEYFDDADEILYTFLITGVDISRRLQPDRLSSIGSIACHLSQAVPVLRVMAPAMKYILRCQHLVACRLPRTWDTMPTMAMQSLNLGGMTRPQTAAAYRSRCAVRTMAVAAAPLKTGLKTEISEKVRLFRGIVNASMTAMQTANSHLWCARGKSGSCSLLPPCAAGRHCLSIDFLGRADDAA